MILSNENSLIVFFSADICHVFLCQKTVYGTGVFVSGSGPLFPKFLYDIHVRIHTLTIYQDIVVYNIVGDTKFASLLCFPFIPKFQKGTIISTRQYTNYQNFPTFDLKKLLKIF